MKKQDEVLIEPQEPKTILQLPVDILPSNKDIFEYYKIKRLSSSSTTINGLAKEIGMSLFIFSFNFLSCFTISFVSK